MALWRVYLSMGATPPATLAFVIHGPIARADLRGLCERVRALLTETGAVVALCDVCDVQPDAVTVDALARLQLAARRAGCTVRLRGASSELCALVEFMGLADVICTGGSVAPAWPVLAEDRDAKEEAEA